MGRKGKIMKNYYYNNNNKGINILEVIQIDLIILKFLNLIDWSWKAVFMPLWFYLICVFIIIIKHFLDDKR